MALSEIYREFSTYRIGENDISISGRIDEPIERMAIGEYYTGLITKPRAVSGENPGQLYLLWGYNKEEEFSHYKLYRSKEENFLADESTFVADIYLEEYVGSFFMVGYSEKTDITFTLANSLSAASRLFTRKITIAWFPVERTKEYT